jgi:oxygen-independent coproporphyrinogen-3 oxidase
MGIEGFDSPSLPSAQLATLGVYVSVPFCRAKCSFCNFASGVSAPPALEAYVAKLCQEIAAAPQIAARLLAHLPRTVDTIYFGGGTPSLLEPEQLRRIFTALRQTFEITSDAEITLEAAPGQIADGVLAEAQRQGVNRVSLGVQSFVDRESAAVGRSHTERDCIHEILRLQAAGVADVGADLIAGLPYQTSASWQHSLKVATSIGLNHLSVYMLEVDEDSRLGREVMAGGRRFHAHGVPADEFSTQFYETACDWLPQHGFPQYEISNFASAPHQSLHNRKYWQRDPYIGFGLDAHSMLSRPQGAVRFSNPQELALYEAEAVAPTTVDVFQREAFEETIFLGLRRNEGLSLADLQQQFSADLIAPTVDAANELIREGLMIEQNGRWQLTLRGRLLSNDVFTNLLMGVGV